MKRFSIITSTLNSESCIEECIESVLNQSISNICEHIVIDGQSTDKTLEILNSFKHLKYISERDKGIYSAWNKGIKIANSDFVLFLGSDDILFNKFTLEKVNNYIDDLNTIYYGKVTKRSKDNTEFIKSTLYKFDERRYDPPILYYPPHPASFFPTAVIQEIGFDERFKICGDTDNYIKMLDKCSIKSFNLDVTYFSLGGISNSRKNAFLKWKEKNMIRKRHNLKIPIRYIFISFIKSIISNLISIF
tara:strand:+ start:773 stop:1513 length:741 start_codon:yes stop_codon:yes gene_type:complete